MSAASDWVALVGAAGALDWARVGATAIGYLGALSAAGGFFFLLAFRGLAPAIARRTHRRIGWMAAAAALAGVALIPLNAAFLGGGWAMAADPVLIDLVASSPLGAGVALRAAAAALAIAAAAIAAPRLGAVAGIGLLASLALVGHSAAAGAAPLGLVVMIHLAAVAFWLGALAPLQMAARRGADAAWIMTRFARLASVALAGLFAAGALLAAILLGAPSALWSSSYGLFLLMKLCGVALLTMLAAWHKWRLAPRLDAEPAAAATLARSIGVERWIATAVVLATATLTTLSGPPSG